jgi:redox-sensitive bicupin YhaK (pirin superfamily)
MSGTLPANEPECLNVDSSSIELLIDARPRDLGGFTVRRVLPSPRRRLVGPFIFLDQMGPVSLPAGAGFDVRPHPHIGLATVTYLFEGEFVHRDSLGSLQMIQPGAVNWMVAGRGIVHSERSSPEAKVQGWHGHGIQSWVALPLEHEEDAPSFQHHPAASIPRVEGDGVLLDVVAGSSFGVRSPVTVLLPTLYVHARLERSAKLTIEPEHQERGVYVVEGAIVCDGRRIAPGTMAVLRPGQTVVAEAAEATRLMLVGGATVEGARHVHWNFVSSSKERIEQAKHDWKAGNFPKVPGDESEFIPLPE